MCEQDTGKGHTHRFVIQSYPLDGASYESSPCNTSSPLVRAQRSWEGHDRRDGSVACPSSDDVMIEVTRPEICPIDTTPVAERSTGSLAGALGPPLNLPLLLQDRPDCRILHWAALSACNMNFLELWGTYLIFGPIIFFANIGLLCFGSR